MIHFRIISGTCLVKKKSRWVPSTTSRLYIECLVKSNTFITTSSSRWSCLSMVCCRTLIPVPKEPNAGGAAGKSSLSESSRPPGVTVLREDGDAGGSTWTGGRRTSIFSRRITRPKASREMRRVPSWELVDAPAHRISREGKSFGRVVPPKAKRHRFNPSTNWSCSK